MSRQLKYVLILCLFTLTPVLANAQMYYAPAKVVYDVASSDATKLSHMLDRISLLQNIYQNDVFDASIILVIHEDAIPLFVKNNKTHHDLMQRVKSLIMDEIIQIRVCEASANMQGFYKDDFDSFIRIVPMADAEIIKLQNNGYAYLK